jgi:hypothetical protein
MCVTVVQERDDMPSQMMQYLMQERHYPILSDVIPEEHAKQPQVPSR